MSGFVLHPEALVDLNEIWEFIAADNLEAADRVLEEIREVIGSLVSFPRMGHTREDLTSRPLRFHNCLRARRKAPRHIGYSPWSPQSPRLSCPLERQGIALASSLFGTIDSNLTPIEP